MKNQRDPELVRLAGEHRHDSDLAKALGNDTEQVEDEATAEDETPVPTPTVNPATGQTQS